MSTIDKIISRFSLPSVPESSKAIKKQSDETFEPSLITNSEILMEYSYSITQLKQLCKYYRLKVSGNKSDLLKRVYLWFKISKAAGIIQKSFRKSLLIKYKNLHGPAVFNRSKCVNECDFLTMESVTEIPYSQFISFKDADTDNLIYGFDIISLYNLFIKAGKNKQPQNPYNRNNFPITLRRTLSRYIKLSRLLHIPIELKVETEIPVESTFDFKLTMVFQKMDELGNYTNVDWFKQLDVYGLLKFTRELEDIWSFRAQLSQSVKRDICPINPFHGYHYLTLCYLNFADLRIAVLSIIERFIFSGINREFQYLGASYVLSAFTLVSPSAAEALPWLFQSVAHSF